MSQSEQPLLDLTATNVRLLVADCCASLDTPGETAVIKAVRRSFLFVPAKLKENRPAIEALLEQLPRPFRAVGYGEGAGGGWTFLNACVREDGLQWGQHDDVEMLLALGLAIERVEWSLPRDMWHALPGGVPYFEVKPPVN